MSYLDDALAHLEIFEGIVPWMYLDTRGYVTVGVGEMLATAERAQAMAFVDSSNRAAQPERIAADYRRVSGLAPAKSAAFYRTPESPTLPHHAIDSLLLAHIQFFDNRLSQRFAEYPKFPDSAKLGLLDMIYNLGAGGLFQGYPAFIELVGKQDWLNAAAQCRRKGPASARNDWTKQQFLAAGQAGESLK